MERIRETFQRSVEKKGGLMQAATILPVYPVYWTFVTEVPSLGEHATREEWNRTY